ncbi:aminobutyraldehyde dehydrogenase [Actinoplanes sp. L3-i22]|uniref:aminobutyraldehyde dehydrogenase n=1 Tax=Actinoplanes sp. L3-i22 TaxID=2836373 RepID=UPI001C751CFF|nr:aminobutyraldehyde dehydrogenase [Actinoplanes sp. L3-i22]BCY07607.1 gamma-aminobutyraldehyde dehydrogenase [Actinoplanes sp. L3-i22]
MSTDFPVLRNFVDGSFTDTEEGRTSPVVDPSTGETYAYAPISSERDVAAAITAAEAGFEVWADTTPAERQRALLRIADAVEARAEELIEAECRNTGKPVEATRVEEIGPVLDELRFFAGAARMLEGKAAGEYLKDHTSYVRREPIGVCAQITPWNYPLVMAIWKLAPAIAAGNSVVLKPSDTTPVSTLLLAEIAAEFLPAGVLNVVCGDRDTGRSLVVHPTPQLVSITGSTRAGMEVAAAAAPDLKKVHLELGGKAPVVVFDDVDIAATAEKIAGAGFFNAGQDCTAATRVLVHERIAADFTAALAAAAKNLRVGAPSDPEAYFGPVNNVNQLERVAGFLDRAPAHAEVVAGGNRVGDRGFFFEPTVVAGLRQRDEMIQDEVFGPVITVQPFADEAEAVRFANDVRYGLSASVWTQNHGTAMRVSRRLNFGAVWINTHLPFVSEMPHGGYGHSGYGKDLSMYGFEEYTRIKHVMSFHG